MTHLYVFDDGATTVIAEIVKATGATPTQLTVASSPGAAFAHSFWGGDFCPHSAPAFDQPSTVTRYRYATDRTTAIVVPDDGMTVIGAGVSTCAPTTVL